VVALHILVLIDVRAIEIFALKDVEMNSPEVKSLRKKNIVQKIQGRCYLGNGRVNTSITAL